MKKEEQRIAIAEFCGWRDLKDGTNWLTRPDGQKIFFHPFERSWGDFVPDYLNDLNAIHQAEECLSDTRENDQWSHYCGALNIICCKIHCGGDNRLCGYTIHAPALQRAEALLRTIGKWKD